MSDDLELSPFTPEIALVPLRETDGGPVTERGTPVDLGSRRLDAEVVAELAGASVHLSVPEDLDAAAFEALSELAVPDCFAFSGWLAEHRPLLLRDGAATVEDWIVEHHPEHGLLVREAN